MKPRDTDSQRQGKVDKNKWTKACQGQGSPFMLILAAQELLQKKKKKKERKMYIVCKDIYARM